MAILGEEVADAYISLHADTTRFRADVKKLEASSKVLFREVGNSAGNSFQRAFNKQIRGVSLRDLSVRLRVALGRLQRTLATDLRIIGATLQDRLIKPVNRAMTRAFNGVIVGFGKAKDAVADFGRSGSSVLGGQFANQWLRLRVMTDRVLDNVLSMGPAFLNSLIGMRELLAPGAWDRFTRKSRESATGMRQVADLAVTMFRDSFDRAWNHKVVAAGRVWTADLVRSLGSGLAVAFRGSAAGLASGLDKAGDRIVLAGRKLGTRFDTMWSRITKRSESGAKGATEAVKEFVDDTEVAVLRLARSTEKNAGRADKAINTKFIGRLKGGRNDAVNAIGIIGGAFENLVSGVITRGFKILGGVTSKIGESLLKVGEGAGFLQGPLNGLGALLVRAGAGLSALSATGVGIIVVIGVLVASFIAFGSAIAIVVTLLSSLLAIATALAASAFFALSGVILAIGPAALAAAAGLGALMVGMSELDEEAIQPLTEAFDDLKKKVGKALFGNLPSQLGEIKSILTDFVSPLLVAAAGELSKVFDFFLAGLQSPGVKATLDTLEKTLPTILGNMGRALSDFLLGILNFFGPISEQMVPLSGGIAGIAESFRKWTEKPENMDKIRDFFTQAVESVKVWSGLAGPLKDAVLGLFNEGKATGDGFITSLTGIITQFATWVNSKEGRDEIKQWFTDAKEVARQLKEIIEKVSTAIVQLDTPENRAALKSVLDAVKLVAGAVETLSGLFKDLPGAINAVKNATFLIPGLGAALQGAENLWNVLSKIKNAFSGGKGQDLGTAGVRDANGNQFRKGGILNSPTRILAGEAGREMVVPLVRPLSQVDPSVRAVSAFARGMDSSSFNSGFNANQPSKVVNIQSGAVQFTAPTDEPEQVANAVLDRLVARWK